MHNLALQKSSRRPNERTTPKIWTRGRR